MSSRTRPARRSLIGAAAALSMLGVVSAVPAAGLGGAPATQASTGARLIGRWERVTTCRQLVRALKRYGLGPTAPAMLAGNGFIPGSPRQIARRRHICHGAVARRHSHFFRDDGEFGSVDFNDQQVDDGRYVVRHGTLRIGGGRWRIRIADGRLHLTPRITAKQRRKALAHPLQFSTAGWMVAVAFPGHAWRRVGCDGWC